MALDPVKLKATPKLDNNPAARAAKIGIRTRVLDAIGADQASVFDAFAGAGEMFSAVWERASRYVGCDEKWIRDRRTMFVADNQRVMRAVDLAQFNVFDLDAYGSPWHAALILADRRKIAKAETIGVIFTDGTGVAMVGNSLPLAAAELGGFKSDVMVGMLRNRDAIIARIVGGFVARIGGTIVKRWEAQGASGGRRGNSQLRYIGLVLKGQESARPTDEAMARRSPAASGSA